MAGKFCTNCGAKLTGTKFCTECGAAVTDQETTLASEMPASQKLTAFDMMMNRGALSAAKEDDNSLKPLSKKIILQGKWIFDQPRYETDDERLKYTEMYMEIKDEQYTIVKDGVEVASGTLGEDHGYIKSHEGGIYAFDMMWTSGIYGNEMVASAESTNVDMHRISEDLKAEFDRVMNCTFLSVDVLKTDDTNHAACQIFFENNRNYMMVYKDRHGIMIEDGKKDSIAADVQNIMKNSELYLFETSTVMPGEGAMTDCFRLLYKTVEGLTFSLKFRGDVPDEALRVARELESLFSKYELEKNVEMQFGPSELAGVWKSEMDDKLILNADGTYQFNEICGRYTIEKNYIMSLDISDAWDRYDHQNRYHVFGHFENIIIKDGYLVGNIFVADMGSMPIKFNLEKKD